MANNTRDLDLALAALDRVGDELRDTLTVLRAMTPSRLDAVDGERVTTALGSVLGAQDALNLARADIQNARRAGATGGE